MYAQGALQWEGVSLAEIAERISTPAFVISEQRLRGNCRDLTRAFPGATLRYCAKADNELSVLRIVAAEGLDVLASHLAEVELALAAGFAPERIAFQRPLLLEDELREVLRLGVRFVHVMRPADVALLGRMTTEAGVQVAVSIRLSHRVGLPLLGRAAQRLGCDPEEALAAARAIRNWPPLRLAALNLYLGTQQGRPAAFSAALAAALKVASRLDVRPLEINLGGGIPAAGTERLGYANALSRFRGNHLPQTASLDAFSDSIRQAWERLSAGRELTLALEPGRSVVSDTAVLLTRIQARQGSWLFVDASRNYSGETPLLFTRRVDAVREVSGPSALFDISGSTLNTVDVVDVRRSLPQKLEQGDVLALFDAGAYSISRAMRYGAMAPAVYLLASAGEIRLVRRPESSADLVAPMQPGGA
jgi:diaminopimelate decarboxylase